MTQIKFQNIFLKIKAFFQKRTKKESQNKRHTRQNEGFFFAQKKWKRQKKTGDAKVDKKTPKTIATIRKDKRNKTKCAHQKN